MALKATLLAVVTHGYKGLEDGLPIYASNTANNLLQKDAEALFENVSKEGVREVFKGRIIAENAGTNHDTALVARLPARAPDRRAAIEATRRKLAKKAEHE